jgi:lipid II:glycine glycyltransferase (peptidoglycan interpeptide bridge formation enzyme)
VKIQIIDPITDSRWDEFVSSQKHSTIFHTSAWARVIREAYRYSPRYYVLENADRFQAAIPFYFVRSILTGKRLVCLPFSDYCWPLGEDEADITSLLNSARQEIEAGKASYLEIRGGNNGFSPTQSNLVTRNFNIFHLLDLTPGADALKKGFHDGVKDGIRQAGKRGVTVRLSNNKEDLDTFFKLHIATRQKLGVLPQPYIFFKVLYHHLISPRHGFMAMGECEGKVIAASIFLTHKDNVYYKFSASDESYLQKRPNHMVIWEAIRYACANNYKYFDFGRCSPEEKGLRAFKLGWGTKEIDLPYFYYPEIKGLTAASGNGVKYKTLRLVLHMMPQFAFKAAGSLLYKHLA